VWQFDIFGWSLGMIRRRETNQSGSKIYKERVSGVNINTRLASNKAIINVKMVRAADKYYNFPANEASVRDFYRRASSSSARSCRYS